MFFVTSKRQLSTRNILRRKNRVLPSYDCVLCGTNSEKTLQHLFITCPFAQDCWNLLHLIVQFGDPFLCLVSFRNQLAISFSMGIIILMSWCIWMERNDFIFKGIQPNLNSVKARFKIVFSGYPSSKAYLKTTPFLIDRLGLVILLLFCSLLSSFLDFSCCKNCFFY